ncbi:MAG: DUF4111 domain-containing protein [Chloroflexota bacterium]|nr:DUF4111 domain-containing protein [Chloroflexota bacterium]
MAQYTWAVCLASIHARVQAFCEQVRIILGADLMGIYLHGSLALGCFNPELSDIDLLVVTQRRMSVAIKRQIMEQLLQLSNAPCPIEISFLVEPEIHPFRHPLPFDLHYSEFWRQETSQAQADGTWRQRNDVIRSDPDLAAHLMIAHRRGITLYGRAAASVLLPVPGKAYAQAIIRDYSEVRDTHMKKPVYFILNACRVHAYLTEGHIFSKDEGGVYGIEKLPAQFHTLINQALEIYRGERQDVPFNEDMLAQFATYMDQYILAKQ